jgi:hypothetical protein
MLALQLAMQIAGGLDWIGLGKLGRGAVLYLPAEDPWPLLHQRLFALQRYKTKVSFDVGTKFSVKISAQGKQALVQYRPRILGRQVEHSPPAQLAKPNPIRPTGDLHCQL